MQPSQRRRAKGIRTSIVVALSVVLPWVVACGGSVEATPSNAPSFEELTFAAYAPNGDTYTQELVAATHQLSWDYTDASGDPIEPKPGSRTLNDAEFRSVDQAVRKIRVTHSDNCGADAGVVTVDLQTTDGLTLYADDFYSGCPWELQQGRTFATGLNELSILLDALAEKP